LIRSDRDHESRYISILVRGVCLSSMLADVDTCVSSRKRVPFPPRKRSKVSNLHSSLLMHFNLPLELPLVSG
jgi:hypothetical protein